MATPFASATVRIEFVNRVLPRDDLVPVRWLRPDYQIPRFAEGVDNQAAKEEGAQVATELVAAVEQKPSFPSGAVEHCYLCRSGCRQQASRCQVTGGAIQAHQDDRKEGRRGSGLAGAAWLRHIAGRQGFRVAPNSVAHRAD